MEALQLLSQVFGTSRWPSGLHLLPCSPCSTLSHSLAVSQTAKWLYCTLAVEEATKQQHAPRLSVSVCLNSGQPLTEFSPKQRLSVDKLSYPSGERYTYSIRLI